MKTTKHALLGLICLLFTVTAAWAQKKQEEVKIKTSAVCKMCKATIERQLAFTKGVQHSELDVPSKVVTVVYNPRKTDAAAIRKAINESGYDADELPAEPKAYEKLESCCKKDQATHEN